MPEVRIAVQRAKNKGYISESRGRSILRYAPAIPWGALELISSEISELTFLFCDLCVLCGYSSAFATRAYKKDTSKALADRLVVSGAAGPISPRSPPDCQDNFVAA